MLKNRNHLSPQYIAGFFDGEGGIGIGGSHRVGHRFNTRGQRRKIDHIRWSRRVYFTNTYKPLMEAIQKQYGGTLSAFHGNPPTKLCWRLDIHGEKAANILKEMLPHLIIKQSRAELFLEFMNTRRQPGKYRVSQENLKRRYAIYLELLTLNARGIHGSKEPKLKPCSPQCNIAQ